MAAEVKKEIELEIAHVLFIDIVAYSKLSVNEQHARIEKLNEIVRSSEQFRKAETANRILKIPTGDGMALVFYSSPDLAAPLLLVSPPPRRPLAGVELLQSLNDLQLPGSG